MIVGRLTRHFTDIVDEMNLDSGSSLYIFMIIFGSFWDFVSDFE